MKSLVLGNDSKMLPVMIIKAGSNSRLVKIVLNSKMSKSRIMQLFVKKANKRLKDRDIAKNKFVEAVNNSTAIGSNRHKLKS